MTELETIHRVVRASLAALEASRRRIDDLNVYPVPDGDTGTNLTLTARSVAEALGKSRAADRAALAKEITRAALTGARGNSGVILSQIVRGAAEVLGRTKRIDPAVCAAALRGASDAAYRAVRKPVEGTMLTVIRELAEEGERRAQQGLSLPDFIRALVRHGEAALARTPEQLAALRQAGVVDAGGAGIVEIVRGLVAGVTGERVAEAPAGEALSLEAVHRELSRFRYCTVFLVEGEGLDAAALEHELEQLGDSLLVVGDSEALKVHVHTDDPGAALRLGTAVGVIDGIEIANMHEQAREREGRLAGGAAAAVGPASSE
ncbi:MAG: DAK2 domain-containing protein, partial [Actinobacteria bacterium]|nr:DAK2 domain-containing protein [Actinomycetota bacterium]